MQSNWTEKWCESEEGRLRVMVGPAAGPPVLCLHGVTRNWKDWLPISPALCQRWQLFCLDFRGHGGSQRTPGKYLVRDYVRDARAALRSVVREPAMVIGHSLGAMVAAAVADSASSDVRGVVLEDPPFDTLSGRIFQTPFLGQFKGVQTILSETSSVPEIARRLADLVLSNPQTGQTYRLGDTRDAAAIRFNAWCLSRMDPEALEPVIAGRWLEGFDVEQVIRSIRCPTLVLQGEAALGSMLTEEDAKRLTSTVVDAVHVRVRGVGHQIHAVQAEATSIAIVGFLETLE